VADDSFLLPGTDEYSEDFWAGFAEGRLLVQTCSSCGSSRYPTRPMCPECRSLDYHWQEASGRGTIWSFVVAHPPVLPAYGEFAPYNVVVVELEDFPGIRLVGNLVAGADAPINSVDPHSISIGEPVEIVFSPVADDLTFPRWSRPVP